MDGGDGIIMCMCLMPQNYTLRNGYNGNFYNTIFVFYYN